MTTRREVVRQVICDLEDYHDMKNEEK